MEGQAHPAPSSSTITLSSPAQLPAPHLLFGRFPCLFIHPLQGLQAFLKSCFNLHNHFLCLHKRWCNVSLESWLPTLEVQGPFAPVGRKRLGSRDSMQTSEKPSEWRCSVEKRRAEKHWMSQPSTTVVARRLLAWERTTCLLSSAKVALTNMAPKAKPRLLSVSLMQNFQRGRQVCMGQEGVISGGTAKAPHLPSPLPHWAMGSTSIPLCQSCYPKTCLTSLFFGYNVTRTLLKKLSPF